MFVPDLSFYENASVKMEADCMRIQKYVDSQIRCPMDIEEQKALCRLMLAHVNALNVIKR